MVEPSYRFRFDWYAYRSEVMRCELANDFLAANCANDANHWRNWRHSRQSGVS